MYLLSNTAKNSFPGYECAQWAEIKPYSVKELGQLYNVTGKTIFKWLAPFKKEIGERVGRYYTVLQVEIIFLKLGVPYSLFIEIKKNG